MDIKLLPTDARCLIDANIFIYHLGQLSDDCKSFFNRIGRGEVEAHITTIIIAEILHRQMIIEAVTKGVV